MVAWVSQVLLFPMAAITFSQQSTYSHRRRLHNKVRLRMFGDNPARFQVGWGLDSRVRGNDEGLPKGLHRASGMTRLFSEDGVASKSKVSNISSEGTLAVLILWCAMR